MPDAPDSAGWSPPPGRAESPLPSLLCVAAAIVLQLTLPDRLTVGTFWLVPALETALLIGLAVASPMKLEHGHRWRREGALALTAFVSAANTVSLALLTHYLLHHNPPHGRALIIAGAVIWLTNVLIFGLWYWEIDRGGPGRRALGRDQLPDLLFQPMSDGRFTAANWRPGFVDYLYVSFTNATAFSPTDTMPMTARAKLMMGLQSLVSLVTIGLVVSRAVSLL